MYIFCSAVLASCRRRPLSSNVRQRKCNFRTSRARRIRPPEPYKGKGVRYQGETVRRKEGKKK